MTSPTKTLKSKTFHLFVINQNHKHFPIFREFEQLSTSIGWRVMAQYVGTSPTPKVVGRRT